MGVRPLGALTGGALGTTFGLHTAIWVAAIGGVTGVLWLLPSPVFALRTLDIKGTTPRQPAEPGPTPA